MCVLIYLCLLSQTQMPAFKIMFLFTYSTYNGKWASLGSVSMTHLVSARDRFPLLEIFQGIWPQEGALFLCLLIYLLTILIHACPTEFNDAGNS